MPHNETFILFVFVLVALGIIKDIILLSQWFEKWLGIRNGNHKPCDMESMQRLFKQYAEAISEGITVIFEKHAQAQMVESQKTNLLLTKFLIGQQVIAKNVHGIDIDV